MRIDPKFFNIFVVICALVGVIVIFVSTIWYSQKKVSVFEDKIIAARLDTLSFRSYSKPDSLFMSDIVNQPIVIQFWATWSEKSKTVNEFLNDYTGKHTNLRIVAAAVRDSDEKVREYKNQHTFPFDFVDGTDLSFLLMVPGIPSQILIDDRGEYFDIHIGDDTKSLEKKLNGLVNDQ